MNKRIELMNEALGESGIVPFHAIDTPLVSELCEIIGVLYRGLEEKANMREREIEELFV